MTCAAGRFAGAGRIRIGWTSTDSRVLDADGGEGAA